MSQEVSQRIINRQAYEIDVDMLVRNYSSKVGTFFLVEQSCFASKAHNLLLTVPVIFYDSVFNS